MKRCKLIHSGRTVASGIELNSSRELAEHLGKSAVTISWDQAEAIRKMKEELEQTLYFLWEMDRWLAIISFVIKDVGWAGDKDGFLAGGVKKVVEVVIENLHSRQEIVDSTILKLHGFDKIAEAS